MKNKKKQKLKEIREFFRNKLPLVNVREHSNKPNTYIFNINSGGANLDKAIIAFIGNKKMFITDNVKIAYTEQESKVLGYSKQLYDFYKIIKNRIRTLVILTWEDICININAVYAGDKGTIKILDNAIKNKYVASVSNSLSTSKSKSSVYPSQTTYISKRSKYVSRDYSEREDLPIQHCDDDITLIKKVRQNIKENKERKKRNKKPKTTYYSPKQKSGVTSNNDISPKDWERIGRAY